MAPIQRSARFLRSRRAIVARNLPEQVIAGPQIVSANIPIQYENIKLTFTAYDYSLPSGITFTMIEETPDKSDHFPMQRYGFFSANAQLTKDLGMYKQRDNLLLYESDDTHSFVNMVK